MIDGCLDIMIKVVPGLAVYPATIRKNLMAELPFMATENLMMAAVKKGADRQDVHELIRSHSQAAGARVKQEALDNDLLERLRKEPLFAGIDIAALTDPALYVGRSPEQVGEMIESVVEPIRKRYAGKLGLKATINV